MDTRHLKDPAAGVPQQLLPHLHLVSKHRYPILPNPPIEQIVNYLVEAPKIMREASPVQWQYLDGPPDGSMFLVWQPHEMQTSFASDGYVWPDTEAPFNSEVRGHSVQMLWHRMGYKPNVEQVATHCRKRYRLVPNNQMGGSNPDPCLWLVHYSKAQVRDQHPASSLPVPPHVAQSFQQRAAIQRSGQIPRKEFMLHDRASWPIITLPATLGRGGSAGQIAAGHRRAGSLPEHQATLEEEEDVSRGDALDFMTPREISRMRYEQHHEWMEEILESHYATKNIIPSELGLGRKGTLESFTNGFFTAPTSTVHEPVNGKVGKLPPGKAEEFAKHAEQKLAEMQAELDKMKEDHHRRMEKLRRTTLLGSAERKLRNMNTADDSYKAIGATVQDLVGRKIEPVQHLALVSKGGLQDIRPIAPPSQENFGQGRQSQYPQQGGSTQSQPQQQQQTQPQKLHPQNNPPPPQQQQPSKQSPQQNQNQNQDKPQNQQSQQPQANVQAPAATMQQTRVPQAGSSQGVTQPGSSNPTPPIALPGHLQGTTQVSSNAETPETTIENNDAVSTGNDLDMEDSADQDLPNVDEDNQDSGDWDMLVDQTGDPDPDAEEQSTNNQQSGSQQQSLMNQGPNQSINNTPGADLNDFDMVEDFDQNMDTAGDALADYGGGDDDLNLEESAFGDAFHSHEQDMA